MSEYDKDKQIRQLTSALANYESEINKLRAERDELAQRLAATEAKSEASTEGARRLLRGARLERDAILARVEAEFEALRAEMNERRRWLGALASEVPSDAPFNPCNEKSEEIDGIIEAINAARARLLGGGRDRAN